MVSVLGDDETGLESDGRDCVTWTRRELHWGNMVMHVGSTWCSFAMVNWSLQFSRARVSFGGFSVGRVDIFCWLETSSECRRIIPSNAHWALMATAPAYLPQRSGSLFQRQLSRAWSGRAGHVLSAVHASPWLPLVEPANGEGEEWRRVQPQA